jgi:hypothetical protein
MGGRALPADGDGVFRDGEESFVVSWKYPDGTVASGHPLPRERAEALCRIYSRMYPDQTYWLEPLRLTEMVKAPLGRVQRNRARRKKPIESQG